MPVCAIIASRLACALVRMASVTTTTSVVFSTAVASGPPLTRNRRISGVHAAGMPRPPRPAPPAILAVLLERRGPGPRPVADGDAADRIDHGKCCNLHAALRRR